MGMERAIGSQIWPCLQQRFGPEYLPKQQMFPPKLKFQFDIQSEETFLSLARNKVASLHGKKDFRL